MSDLILNSPPAAPRDPGRNLALAYLARLAKGKSRETMPDALRNVAKLASSGETRDTDKTYTSRTTAPALDPTGPRIRSPNRLNRPQRISRAMVP